MEITWLGQAAFRLKGKEASLVHDPYVKGPGGSMPRVAADIVTISQETPDHNHVAGVSGTPRVLRGPGEYEIKGVFVTGIAAPTSEEGRGKITLYLVYLDDLMICHLDGITQGLGQEQIEAMEHVDIVLIPIGGGVALNPGPAAEVVNLLEPKVAIPVPASTLAGPDVIARFYKEIGVAGDPPRQPHYPAIDLQASESGDAPLEVSRQGSPGLTPPITWRIGPKRGR